MRAAKNILKATIYLIAFLLIDHFIFPVVSSLIEGQPLSNLFTDSVTVFLIFSILSALASGTVLQPAFSFARALVPIAFTVLAYEDHVLTITLGEAAAPASVTLSVDIGTVLIFLLLLDLILLARETLQLLGSINKRVV
jgi:hypothetical protein